MAALIAWMLVVRIDDLVKDGAKRCRLRRSTILDKIINTNNSASKRSRPSSDQSKWEKHNMPAAETVVSGAYAELPGVKLWFTDTGGAGVPVVLLHPNTGTVEIWQPQIAAFAAAGYRVIAFDRKGWGRSLPDPASGAQPGSIAGDLDALADHLKLEKFHLLGVAGGGFIALDYAAW